MINKPTKFQTMREKVQKEDIIYNLPPFLDILKYNLKCKNWPSHPTFDFIKYVLTMLRHAFVSTKTKHLQPSSSYLFNMLVLIIFERIKRLSFLWFHCWDCSIDGLLPTLIQHSLLNLSLSLFFLRFLFLLSFCGSPSSKFFWRLAGWLLSTSSWNFRRRNRMKLIWWLSISTWTYNSHGSLLQNVCKNDVLRFLMFVPPAVRNSQDILFTTSLVRERQEILTFEELKQEKVSSFCSIFVSVSKIVLRNMSILGLQSFVSHLLLLLWLLWKHNI